MVKESLICDLDSVCANYHEAFTRLIRKHINPDAPLIRTGEQALDWDWVKWYPITKKELSQAWNILRSSENFWLDLFTIDADGIKTLNNLKNLVDIYFVTNRITTAGFSAMRQSQLWLEEAGFQNPNVFVTDRKHEFARLVGNVKYFIDDKPHYYSREQLEGTNYKILGIIDYPYNRHIIDPSVQRFVMLSDFTRAVKESIIECY